MSNKTPVFDDLTEEELLTLTTSELWRRRDQAMLAKAPSHGGPLTHDEIEAAIGLQRTNIRRAVTAPHLHTPLFVTESVRALLILQELAAKGDN